MPSKVFTEPHCGQRTLSNCPSPVCHGQVVAPLGVGIGHATACTIQAALIFISIATITQGERARTRQATGGDCYKDNKMENRNQKLDAATAIGQRSSNNIYTLIVSHCCLPVSECVCVSVCQRNC